MESQGIGLGDLLRAARERRGLTLEQISNETKIPQRHLEALEHEDLGAAPGAFYRRAEVRAYARTVQLDQKLALEHLERALEARSARGAGPVAPRTRGITISGKQLLIVAGAVVVAALLARGRSQREPATDEGRVRAATEVSQRHASPEPTLPATAGSSERGSRDRAATGQATPGATAPDHSALAAPGVAPDRTSAAGIAVEAPVSTTQAVAASVTALVVRTQPAGARVTVNGIGWGITPLTIRYLPPGDMRIRVSKDGYSSAERVAPLEEGRVTTVDIRLRGLP